MRNDEEERFNELEEEQYAAAEETDAELAATESEAPAMVGAPTEGHPESATDSGPYVSEDGAVMGRDFVIPGVDPREHDPYRFHTGRKRDHGGEDAIEIKDLVKQFGRARGPRKRCDYWRA